MYNKKLGLYFRITSHFVYMSLNKNSNYCEIPCSTKHTDMCNVNGVAGYSEIAPKLEFELALGQVVLKFCLPRASITLFF